jgi:hypothetical protein
MMTATGRSSDSESSRVVWAVHDLVVERPVVPGVVLADEDGEAQGRSLDGH